MSAVKFSFKPTGGPQVWFSQPVIFLKWMLFACITGMVIGVVSAAFSACFHWAVHLRAKYPWLLLLLPAAGAAIAFVYRACGMEHNRGTSQVLDAVGEDAPVPLRTAPLVFVSTILTHLVGGSSGREGAILQIGGSIASSVGRYLRLEAWDRRALTMCGMSAAFSTLFGTPLAAATFVMEVVSVGVLYDAAIVPCVLSALVGLLTARTLGVPGTDFTLAGIPDLAPLTLIQAVGMGVLFALLSILFCRIMHLPTELREKSRLGSVSWAALGGGLVIGLTLLVWLWNPGTFDYNGAGEDIIHAAAAGQARPEAFLLKIIFTAVTLGAGFKGGEIVPVFFTGATFGCVAAPLLGLHPSFGAGLGMVSLFCGVTNCPVTSLLLAVELFAGDSPGLLTGHSLGLFAASIGVSFMLSGYYGLYNGQKFAFSKLRHEPINLRANEHTER